MTDRAVRIEEAVEAVEDGRPLRETVGGVGPVKPRPWVRSFRSALEIVQGRHVRIWIAVVLATILIGTVGYIVLFRWNLADAAYMTVITMTTVGFREVRELVGWPERLWTMLLAISGVGIIYGSIGIVAEAVIAEATSGRREARKMAEAVSDLRGHYILCGYGRVGSTVARELVHAGQRLVVIDILAESLERARLDGHLVVQGDATSDDTLRLAGVEVARGLVATIDSDANNVYVTLSARALNPRLFIVGRANAVGADAKLTQAGADRVVSPYTMAGRRMAELAIRPRVADFIDAALSHGDLRFSMEELEIAAGGPLDGRTVAELRDDGIFTLAIVGGDADYEPNPPPDRALVAGESLVVSGSTEQLKTLRERA
ncbi:MAG TPA: potassium channel protein [Candidatus Limnocylindrales bacterium]|nr:potassium channel protein [Candidatus Limnocylindrales bacterium]